MHSKIFSILFVVSLTACITQIDSIPESVESNEHVVDPGASNFEETEKVLNNDCGYEEIVVENPDGSKIVSLVPLSCKEEIIDTVCDPTPVDHQEKQIVIEEVFSL